MEAGLSTLEMEAAENVGEDWEELVDQRAYELQTFKERGLEPPKWAQAEQFSPDKIEQPEAK